MLRDSHLFKTLQVKISDAVGYITLNRPKKMNALNAQVLKELIKAAHWFNQQNGVRVVIINGNGRAFSAGADLNDPLVSSLEDTTWIERRERGQLGLRMNHHCTSTWLCNWWRFLVNVGL